MIDSVTYWKNLELVELAYTVNPGDAARLEYSVWGENAEFGVTLNSGSGSISDGSPQSGVLTAEPDEEIGMEGSLDVSWAMSYQMESGGDWTSASDNGPHTPTVIQLDFAETTAPTASGPLTARAVNVSFAFDYSADSRYTYDLAPTGIGLMWVTDTGNTVPGRMLWPLDDEPCPDLSVTKDTSAGKITYSYTPTLAFTADNGLEPPADATHFILYFITENGTASYTNENNETITKPVIHPKEFETSPIPISPGAAAYTAPEFTKYSPKDMSDFTEITFSILLNDAAEQQGTATLWRKVTAAAGGFPDDFTQVADVQAVYHGHLAAGGTWEVPDTVNSEFMMAEPFHCDDHGLSGAIEWFKVRFQYTLPDNSSGTIESDALPVCHGTYIGTGEVMQMGSGFGASFQLDTALVDPTKVTGSATIDIGGTTVTMPVFSVSDDGEVWVACGHEYLAGQGLSLAGGATYEIELSLTYDDSALPILWKDYSSASFTTPNWGNYVHDGSGTALTSLDPPGTDGFVARFELDPAVVHDPAEYGSTGESLAVQEFDVVYGSSVITLPGTFTYEFYSIDNVPFFAAIYTAPTGEPLEAGVVYKLYATLCYNSSTVTDLLSSGAASFAVGGTLPPYGMSMTVSDLTALDSGTDFCQGTVVFSYDTTPGYSYTTAIDGLTVEWTDDKGTVTEAALSAGDYEIDDPVYGSGTRTYTFRIARSVIPENTASCRVKVNGLVTGSGGSGSYSDNPSAWSASIDIQNAAPSPGNPVTGGSFSWTTAAAPAFHGVLSLVDGFAEDDLGSFDITILMNDAGSESNITSEFDFSDWHVVDNGGTYELVADSFEVPFQIPGAVYTAVIDITYRGDAYNMSYPVDVS